MVITSSNSQAKWAQSGKAELPGHGPSIFTEIYGVVLLEEEEDKAMVASSHGREGGKVMADLLPQLDVIAWDVCSEHKEV